MSALKNPQAFSIEGKREFAIAVALNGYSVVMEALPDHHDLIGCDRICLHVDVFDNGSGPQVGVKGATKVLEDNNPGDRINLVEHADVVTALQNQYYGDKLDSIVLNLINEAGGQEEILTYLKEHGRLQRMFGGLDELIKALEGK